MYSLDIHHKRTRIPLRNFHHQLISKDFLSLQTSRMQPFLQLSLLLNILHLCMAVYGCFASPHHTMNIGLEAAPSTTISATADNVRYVLLFVSVFIQKSMKYGDTNIIQRISRQDKSCEKYRHILLVDGRVLFQTLRYNQQKESLGLQGLSN